MAYWTFWRKLALSLGIVAAVFAGGSPGGPPVSPTPPGGSLYQQEGTEADGYPEIDASGRGPTGRDLDNWTNWKYQYGSSTHTAVYESGGWVSVSTTGSRRLHMEADIEISVQVHSAVLQQTGDMDQFTMGMTSSGGFYVAMSVNQPAYDASEFSRGIASDALTSNMKSWAQLDRGASFEAARRQTPRRRDTSIQTADALWIVGTEQRGNLQLVSYLSQKAAASLRADNSSMVVTVATLL